MKKKLPTILIILIFAAGLGVLLYPTISDYVNSRAQTRAIATYNESLSGMDRDASAEILAAAQRYNQKLATEGIGKNAAEDEAEYQKQLITDHSDLLCYIEIPKIEVRLPVYHGTSDAVLQTGIGHLYATSLPVGGESTHAALSGHRGLPTATLLSDLNKMELGDIFVIHVLGLTLTYQVDRIDTVEPTDTKLLNIVPGADYVTLITCTPYGINTHRLLVRGTRIENIATDAAQNEPLPGAKNPAWPAELVMLLALTTIAVIFLLLCRRHRRKRRNAAAKKPQL